MPRLAFTLVALLASLFVLAVPAYAAGPSGSTECHIQDDDCDGQIDEDAGSAGDDNDGDGRIDEDTGTALDDNDGDGRIDEDPAGDVNGDGNPDDDGDGRIDEDPADDDGDGAVNEDPADDDGDGAVDEDPVGDAADDPAENQVDCNEQTSTDVTGLAKLYAGANGVEVCADDGSQFPVDGRATVTTDQGGYAAIDGDNSNPAPGNGYARLDQGGLHCGDETNQDSSADQSGNTAQDCG
jgi:hypothetical protein